MNNQIIPSYDMELWKIDRPFAAKVLSDPQWFNGRRYTNKVLNENWFEDRRKEEYNKGDESGLIPPIKGSEKINFYRGRTGYTAPPPDYRADAISRRRSQVKQSGQSKECLFEHHGDNYYCNNITWYDQDYNKRDRKEGTALPDLRKWDLQQVAWVPEKTDFPMKGSSTNWGLHGRKSVQWKKEVDELEREQKEYPKTIYHTSFNRNDPVPLSYYPHRMRTIAVPDSALLHTWNNRYQDQHLRNVRVHRLRFPENTERQLAMNPVVRTRYMQPWMRQTNIPERALTLYDGQLLPHLDHTLAQEIIPKISDYHQATVRAEPNVLVE